MATHNLKRHWLLSSRLFCWFFFVVVLHGGLVQGQETTEKPGTSLKDVSYGEHPRQALDVWFPDEKGEKDEQGDRPVLLYFHGGGFVAGDKSSVNPAPYLRAGFVVVSANYRLVDGEEVKVQQSIEDAVRAVQFLKSKSGDWRFDSAKVVLSGGSAGAVLAMWVGYHDDLAKPDSADPIARQSTRVAAVVPLNGPTRLDPPWIRKHLGGPHDIFPTLPAMYGENWDSPEGYRVVRQSSPWELVDASDPPTFLAYTTRMTALPLPKSAAHGDLVHHPYFGKVLQERLEELDVPCQWLHGVGVEAYPKILEFLAQQGIEP